MTEGSEVITWDAGNFGKFFGVKNWGYKPVFQEGLLSSSGELRLSGETILNQGSDITAKGDMNINVDKLVEQDWVAKTYKSGQSANFSGLTITRSKTTDHVTRGSTISPTGGSVNINVGIDDGSSLENEASQPPASRRGNSTFKNTASDIFAEKDININAENIEISDGVHQSWNEHESLGLNFELPARASLDYTNTEYTTTTQRSSNLIANGNINITAGNGLSITGSNLIAGEDINLSIRNTNIQNGEYVDQMTQYGFSSSMGIGGTDWKPSTSNTIWHSEGRQEKLTPSNLVSGNNLKIEAENLNIEASNLASKNGK